MTNRTKTMLFSFVDYLLCLLLQLFCMMAFAKLLRFHWGNVLYSIFFSFLLAGMLYSRTHRAAKRDMLQKNQRTLREGLYMMLPLTIFNLVIALGFFLIQSNFIPVRDMVVTTVYSFPENAPRVATDILLIDWITPWVRIWFGVFLGFMQTETSAVLLFLMPVLNLAAGALGYVAGVRKFFLSDHLFTIKEKVKEKFNE